MMMLVSVERQEMVGVRVAAVAMDQENSEFEELETLPAEVLVNPSL